MRKPSFNFHIDFSNEKGLTNIVVFNAGSMEGATKNTCLKVAVEIRIMYFYRYLEIRVPHGAVHRSRIKHHNVC